MSDIGKIIRVNALPPPDKRENNVIYQVAAPGAATYKDYAIDANGDLKTPAYIPLTGTVEGKPLTKNIEVDPVKEGAVGFISNTPDLSKAALTIQQDGSILAESRKDTDNISSSIHLHHDTGVEITATTSDKQFSAIVDTSGLQGDDYIPPSSDEHYVQRKYITDNFTSQANLNSTLADYYTSAQTDDLFYDKTEVDAKLSAVYRPKGSVANYASLPSSGNTEGDVWNILETGANYVWVINLNNTGVAGWDKLSETVDLTAYISTTGNYNITGKKWFLTDGGNTWDNNTARILSINNRDAGLTFFRSGIDVGQIIFDGYRFNFTNDNNSGGFKQIKTEGYIKNGSDVNHVLTGDGGHKAISDFALSSQLGNYHNIDFTDSINNGSNTRTNKSWFDYDWAGTGNAGSVINFSGHPNLDYSTELFANYTDDNIIGIRTRNGDTELWNPVRYLWHSGNLNPFPLRSSQAGTDANNEILSGLRSDYIWTNTPISTIGTLLVENYSDDWIAQTFTVVGNGVAGDVWKRVRHSGTTWTSWIKMWSGNDFNPSNYIDKTTNDQYLTGRKVFYTLTGSTGSYVDNALWVFGDGGANASMTFQKGGVDTGQIVFDGYYFNFMNFNTSGYKELKTAGYIKIGSDGNHVLLGDGNHKAISDFALSSQLSNYLTINTPQEIEARKIFRPGAGNRYDEASLELRGRKSDSIHPTLSFHVPGFYAATLSFRNNGFNFMNDSGDTLTDVNAAKFIKGGSDDSYILLGGGGHLPVSSFASSNYIGYQDNREINPTEMEPMKFGYGFGTWDNNIATSTYADYLHFGGYPDASGGNQNLIAINRNGFGIRQYQAPWQSSSNYTDYVDYFHNGTTIDYSDALTNIITAGGSSWGWRKLLSRGWNPTYGFFTEINVPSSVSTTASFLLSENGNGYIGNKTIWHEGNFIPGSKANAMQNATGVGFSSGNLPTNDGVEYPYFYYNNGTDQGFIPIATQGWVNYRFNNLSNDYVSLTGAAQSITSSKTFNSSSQVVFQGNDQNNVIVYKTSAGVAGLVSGHEYTHYNTRWRAGNKRGDGTNSLGFSFEFSNDGGATYTEKARIDEAGFFTGNAFASPVITGAQVFNANNANQLFFGNDVIPSVFYQTLGNHVFQVNGNIKATMNSGGVAVTGALSLNGSDVITEAQRGTVNGFAPLGTDSKISSAYLPSYVDDVLEFTNLAAFPATGESGKIYVALDTNLTYRWGGSSYILISSGAVQSVNGQTGVVNLSKTDVGLANADNTSDAVKNVLSATKWTTPRTLSYTGDVTGSASVDGSGNVGFAMTLANSGVSAGTYNSVNVDAKGRVLSGSNINYATESYLTTFLQQNYFNQTASDERFVNANGDEVINGNKTFISSPTIPAATNGDHAVNLEQLTASLSNVVRDNDDFEILEIYRLIDSNPFDLDDPRVKKYNIVFDGASNGAVNITYLRDNQYYQFSNVSGSGADLRINVEGYGAVDAVSSGKTAVYMSWGGGKLLKISENDHVSII